MHEDIADDLVRSCVRCNPVASANLQRILADDLVRQAADVLLNAESVPGLAEALLALNDLLGIPDAERQAIVQHPSFRFWLQAMRRTSGGRNPPRHAQLAAELPALVWPTLVKCGTLDRPMTVRADLHGGMRCSPLGRYIELGATCADALYKVRPRSSDGGASLIGPDGVTVFVPGEDLCGGADTEAEIDEHGYRVAVAPRTAGNAIEVSARDPWLRVVLTGTMQRQDGTEFFGISSGLYTDHPPLVGFEAAFQLIRQEWAAGYGDIPFFSRVLVPADFGASLRSAFTVSSRQGAIFIGNGTPDELVEMILHENAHVKLRQIQMLDTLLEDPLDEQVRISVPWRPDPRPMPGIFEGLFVFAHVAEYHKRRAARIGCDVSRMRIGQLTRDLQHAATALAKHAVLTDRGQEFFKALCVWVDDLSAANSTAEIGTLDA